MMLGTKYQKNIVKAIQLHMYKTLRFRGIFYCIGITAMICMTMMILIFHLRMHSQGSYVMGRSSQLMFHKVQSRTSFLTSNSQYILWAK